MKPKARPIHNRFEVNWDDNTTTWEPWTRDDNLRDNEAVMAYCLSQPHLTELTVKGAAQLDLYKRALREEPITEQINEGDTIYVNVRCLTGQATDEHGADIETDWYRNDFTAEDRYSCQYFYVGRAVKAKAKNHQWDWRCPDLHKGQERYGLPNTFYKKWATLRLPEGAKVVDDTLCRQFPELTIRKLRPTQAGAATAANPTTRGGRGVGSRQI